VEEHCRDERGPTHDTDRLTEAYGNMVRALLRRRLDHEEDIDDCWQDVFVRIHQHLGGYKGKGLSTWIFTIATRTALNHAKRIVARKKREADLVSMSRRRSTASVSSPDADDRQQYVELYTALSRLEEHQRAAIVLRFFERRSPSDIACLLRVETRTVQDRIRKGLIRLRFLLDHPEEDVRS
jgi:RNA polymerase sigma-70 factor (ECF subfamily)